MNAEQRIEHIDKMEVLLEKQRILHTRMQLDPDPQAKEMLNKFPESKYKDALNLAVEFNITRVH